MAKLTEKSENYSDTKEAYDKILAILKSNKEICRYRLDFEDQMEKNLFALKLKSKYGLDIDPNYVNYKDFVRIDRMNLYIGWYGEKHNRTISMPDDDKQPDNELLLNFSFGTGAYIFGEEYLPSLFDEFFKELKTYGPKYGDSFNKNLYFTLDNASDVFENYHKIFDKYQKSYRKKAIEAKKEKLEQELSALGNHND